MENLGMYVILAVGGVLVGFSIRHLILASQIKREGSKAEKIIHDAKEKAKDLEVNAKEKCSRSNRNPKVKMTGVEMSLIKKMNVFSVGVLNWTRDWIN